MKLEPNMYVRLNCNYELGIGKIIREIDEDNFIKAKFKDDFECSVPMYMISKVSHNIVDLIEVGDYVNGYYVSKIWEIGEITHYVDEKPIQRKERKITIQAPSYGGIIHLHNEDIKSIVTKEQMEQMAYKVGE